MRLAFRIASLVLLAIPCFTIPDPMAHADGVCTGKTNPTAYLVCAGNSNIQCGGIGIFGVQHQTCTYPDGSRDECDWHLTSFTTSEGGCQWFPSPAPVPIGPPS